MFMRRTCRACGCSELHACEGGCSWIAADRCSACPDAPLMLPINAAHVRAAAWKVRTFVPQSEGRESHVQQSVEYPTLVRSFRRQNGAEFDRHLFVGALEVPDGDPHQAAELLNTITKAA